MLRGTGQSQKAHAACEVSKGIKLTETESGGGQGRGEGAERGGLFCWVSTEFQFRKMKFQSPAAQQAEHCWLPCEKRSAVSYVLCDFFLKHTLHLKKKLDYGILDKVLGSQTSVFSSVKWTLSGTN